jgi:hypothetical protein
MSNVLAVAVAVDQVGEVLHQQVDLAAAVEAATSSQVDGCLPP